MSKKKSSEFGVTIKLFYCHLGRSNQVAYNMWLFDVGGLAHQISAAFFFPENYAKRTSEREVYAHRNIRKTGVPL